MKRFKIGASLVLLIGLLGIGTWYYYEMQNEMLATQNELRNAKEQVNAKIMTSLHLHDSTMLQLISEPFSWALRRELLSDNMSMVHQYLTQFVKHQEIRMIAVLDVDQKIISCTNKKNEGRFFPDVFPEENLTSDKFSIKLMDDQQHVFHPIMGFDQQIGTLFLIYQLDTTPFSESGDTQSS